MGATSSILVESGGGAGGCGDAPPARAAAQDGGVGGQAVQAVQAEQAEQAESREEQDSLLGELNRQLAKPLDGSDMQHFAQAKQELKRLRFLLSAANVCPCEVSQVVECKVSEESATGVVRSQHAVVPAQPRAVRAAGAQPVGRLSRGLERIGESFEAFRQAKENLGEVFQDAQFPPTQASLCPDWSLLDPASQERWATFTWKRVTEVVGSSASTGLFVGGISPADIVQGGLGDCYLLSALSVLAEYPERVRGLFLNDSMSPIGMYGVRFWLSGEWTEVIVDDMLPYDPATRSFAFAHPQGGGEKWCPLIEKAWAKVNGDYNSTQGGDPAAMMTVLTGCRSDSLDVSDDPRATFEALLDAERRHYVMAAGTGDAFGDSLEKAYGLVSNHAYAILGVFQFPTPNKPGHTTRLVQLRNPWGRLEFNGDWSDTSPLWTDELKRKVGFSGDPDDGVFHMELVDFAKTFRNVAICRVQEDLLYANTEPSKFVVRLSDEQSAAAPPNMLDADRRSCVQLVVDQPGRYALGVHQPGKSPDQCAAVRFWVVQTSPTFKVIGASAYEQDMHVYLDEAHLPAGEYLVWIVGTGLDATDKGTFVLGVSGEAEATVRTLYSGGNQLSVTSAAPNEWRSVTDTMVQAYTHWTKTTGQPFSYAQWGRHDITMHSWSTPNEGVACIVYENASPATVLKETIQLQLQNMNIVHVDGGVREGNTVNVHLPPGQSAVIVIEQKDSDGGFSFSNSRSFELLQA